MAVILPELYFAESDCRKVMLGYSPYVQTGSEQDVRAMPDKSFAIAPSRNYLYIRDTRFTTLADWKNHFVNGETITITYETKEVQSTENITIPSGYKAYKNGTETIVQVNVGETSPSDYGAECTVTQNYYSKTGE